jgi:hypothetical protein
MIKKISEKQVQICCGGNCTFLTFEDGFVFIEDEWGRKAKVPLVEALEISEAAQQFTNLWLNS